MGYQPQVSQDTAMTVRAAAVLTTSYVAAAQVIDLQNWNELTLLLDFTVGASSGFAIKVEVSDANQTNWYAITAIGAATIATEVATIPVYAAEHTFAAVTKKYALPFPVNYRFMRVSAKALVSATSTSLTILATQGLV
jgi:hypothetical protein